MPLPAALSFHSFFFFFFLLCVKALFRWFLAYYPNTWAQGLPVAASTFSNKRRAITSRQGQRGATRSLARSTGADAAANVSDMQRVYQKTFAADTTTPFLQPRCRKRYRLSFVYSLQRYFPCLDFNHYTAANPLQLLLRSVINAHNCPFPLSTVNNSIFTSILRLIIT